MASGREETASTSPCFSLMQRRGLRGSRAPKPSLRRLGTTPNLANSFFPMRPCAAHRIRKPRSWPSCGSRTRRRRTLVIGPGTNWSASRADLVPPISADSRCGLAIATSWRLRGPIGQGTAPMNDAVKRALILVDFINLFDFEHSEKLAARAIEAAKRTAALKKRTKAAGMPCIYANDNFGHWTSEFSALVQDCLAKGGASREIASVLEPERGDYSVLKPRHSAFYETPLQFLLEELKVDSLIVTGLSTDMC